MVTVGCVKILRAMKRFWRVRSSCGAVSPVALISPINGTLTVPSGPTVYCCENCCASSMGIPLMRISKTSPLRKVATTCPKSIGVSSANRAERQSRRRMEAFLIALLRHDHLVARQEFRVLGRILLDIAEVKNAEDLGFANDAD